MSLMLGAFSLNAPIYAGVWKHLMLPFLFSWHVADPRAKSDVFEKSIRLPHFEGRTKLHTTYNEGYLLGGSLKEEAHRDWLLRQYNVLNEPITTYRITSDYDMHFYDMTFSPGEPVGMLGSIERNQTSIPLLASMPINGRGNVTGQLIIAPFPLDVQHLVPLSTDRYLVIGSLLNTSSGKDLFIEEVYHNHTVLRSFRCDVGWNEEVTDFVLTNESFFLTGRFFPYVQEGLSDIFLLEVSRTYDDVVISRFGTQGVDEIASLTYEAERGLQLMGATNVTGQWNMLLVNIDGAKLPKFFLVDVLGDARTVKHVLTPEGYVFFGQNEGGFLMGTLEMKNKTIRIHRWDQNDTVEAHSFFVDQGVWMGIGKVGYNQTHDDLVLLGMEKAVASKAGCSVFLPAFFVNYTGNVTYEVLNTTLVSLNVTTEPVNLSTHLVNLEEESSCYYFNTPTPTFSPLFFYRYSIRPPLKRSYNSHSSVNSSEAIQKVVRFLVIMAAGAFSWVLLIKVFERYGYSCKDSCLGYLFCNEDDGVQLVIVGRENDNIRYTVALY